MRQTRQPAPSGSPIREPRGGSRAGAQAPPPSSGPRTELAALIDSFRVSQMIHVAAKLGIAEDACTEMSEEMHQSALLAFRWAFGRVRSTAEVVHILNVGRESLQ